jgi:hypothetical protein
VVVLRIALLLAVFGRAHPVQIFGEPTLDRVRAFKRAAIRQDLCCTGGFDQVQCVNDSCATSLIQIEDRLRILEVRVHFRSRIDEPRAQMFPCMIGVLLLAG